MGTQERVRDSCGKRAISVRAIGVLLYDCFLFANSTEPNMIVMGIADSFYYINGNIIRTRGYQMFFQLNSAQNEILNAHKYENIMKFNIFQAQISRECCVSCS